MDKEVKKIEAAIIGESPQIRNVIKTARKIAASSSLTTLIIGESGTGKDLIARLIHQYSPFSNQPIVDINCGAIPENLLESELFGHEKGAFTGAYSRKQGLFELARGGTIFLDEIANTSENFQVKLLKVVENKKFRRIGGVEEVSVSTRIVTATNVDLYEASKNGKFREDLYYRLNVYKINLPPLRKRGEDVLLLAQHFIQHFNEEYGKEVKGLSPSASQFVKSYPWPGNIRQLKNAIERAVLVESEEWIETDDLSLDYENFSIPEKPQKAKGKQTQNSNFNRFDIPDDGVALEDVERDLILSALEKAQGNLSHTARLLRINRGKLRYRLEKLGIKSQDVLQFKNQAFSTL